MRSRFSLILRSFVFAAGGFALLLVGLRQASAVEQGSAAGDRSIQTEPDGDGPIVQATERISIPFGFNEALPLTGDALAVASGKGACTAGEEITISFTVAQTSTGAIATGEWNGDCTGALQTWTQAPSATPSPNFDDGEALACAIAETRDDDGVSDTQDWCDPVFLASYNNFLPHIQKP